MVLILRLWQQWGNVTLAFAWRQKALRDHGKAIATFTDTQTQCGTVPSPVGGLRVLMTAAEELLQHAECSCGQFGKGRC
jgi:hypothetical protein